MNAENTRYSATWPHVHRKHAPECEDTLYWKRFVRREQVFVDGWDCVAREIRYNPDDRIAIVFEYPAALTVAVDARPHEAA